MRSKLFLLQEILCRVIFKLDNNCNWKIEKSHQEQKHRQNIIPVDKNILRNYLILSASEKFKDHVLEIRVVNILVAFAFCRQRHRL
jgi:hypothetical protein